MANPTKTDVIKKPRSFDEAITMTGYGKFNFFILLITGGCLMCVIIETTCMMIIVPAAQCDLSLTLSQKGLLSSISFLGVVASSHFWGFLADTRGRRFVLLISLFLGSLISFLCSLVGQSWLFILLRFLNGAVIGGSSAIIYAYAGEFHDNYYRAKVISWMCMFVAFGSMYIPSMAWLVLPENWSFEIPFIDIMFRPWRLLVIFYGLPSLVFGLLLYCLPESPKYLLTQHKYDEVLEILTMMYCSNTGKSRDEYLVSEILWDEYNDPDEKRQIGIFALMWRQTVPLFKQSFLAKTLMASFLQFGIFFTTSGVSMWYPTIINSLAHYSHEVSNENVSLCTSLIYEQEQEELEWITTGNKTCKDSFNSEVFAATLIIGCAYAMTYVAIGIVISAFGKKKLIIFILIIITITGITAQLITDPLAIQLLIGSFILGGSTVGIVNAIVVDLYPTQIRGMAMAISLMFGRLGAMAGANVAGPLFFNFCDYMFYILAADHILVIIVICLLPTGKKIITEAIT